MRPQAAAVVKAGPGVQFAMTAEDFARIRKLVFSLCGISLSAAKVDMAYNRLVRVLRAKGMSAFSQYLDTVEGGEEATRQEFINAMTTNLTRFFREAAHFEMLGRLLAAAPAGRPPSIWCAGCSTGEEAYTIAMLVRERGLDRRIQGRVIGTDVSPAALRVARRGIYREPSFRGVDSRRVAAYFRAAAGGEREVVPEIKEMVSFSRASLMDADAHALFGDIDVAFCRNVLIYFDAESRTRAVRLLYDRLAPGGYLLLGHSETLVARASGFEVVAFRNDTVYRKPKAR